MNDRGADSLLHSKVKLGADASVAAGPVGRTAAADTDAYMRSEILSYSPGSNHRLHHLRGGDGELVLLARMANHSLLQRRNRGVADFHGEVTARDHDAFAGRHDIGEGLGLDGFRALDLGDEEGVCAGGRKSCLAMTMSALDLGKETAR